MKFKVEEPPLKMTKRRRRKKNPTSSTSPSFSSLPDEIVLSCLARVSKSQYHSLCLVSKSFYSLLSSPDIYAVRSELGATESRLYVCIWESFHPTWFTLDETKTDELSLVPVTLSSSSSSEYCYATFNATVVAAGSEIYLIGGAANAKRSNSVQVIDCRNHTWRRCPNMTVPRKNAQACYLDGKIYVTGGCIKKVQAMSWGEVFDVKTQTWKPLSTPPSDSLHHKVAVVGARLHVFTKNNNYAYDPEEGKWVQEVGFEYVALEPSINGPLCVIDNVIYSYYGCRQVHWYDPMYGTLGIVEGRIDRPYDKNAVQLVNHCGYLDIIWDAVQFINHGEKLVIIWEELINIDDGSKCKRIWCAVIRLEKHPSCGVIERYNVVADTVPKSHMLSSCLSVLV